MLKTHIFSRCGAIRHIAEILPACGRQNGRLLPRRKMPSGAAATPHLEKVWGMCGLFFFVNSSKQEGCFRLRRRWWGRFKSGQLKCARPALWARAFWEDFYPLYFQYSWLGGVFRHFRLLAISSCGKELEGFVTFVMLDRRGPDCKSICFPIQLFFC